MYAQVLVQTDAPLAQPLTYRIPDTLALAVGDAVLAPLGAQQVVGHVVGVTEGCPPEIAAKVRSLHTRIANAASFDASLLQLAEWVAEQTLCDLRDALRLVVPDVLSSQIKTTLRLADDWEERLGKSRSAAQKDIAAALASLGGETTPARLAKALGQAKPGPALADLRKKGIVTEERTLAVPSARDKTVRVLRLAVDTDVAASEAVRMERDGAARQARLLRALLESETGRGVPVAGLAVGPSANAAAKALAEKGLAVSVETARRRDPFQFFGFVDASAPPLTDAQAAAAAHIGACVATQNGRTVLLHGVTGSGKTEVYLDAVGRALREGRSALVLLPEIGLTAQTLDLFKARFGEETVAVLHSALSLGERHDEWHRIQSGEARVVVGARSAVFAPVQGLGLIVLDEEHDGSYKQDTMPRYHARDVAQRRAAQSGAPVVLGSATPSLESYYKATRGDYDLLTLPGRISSHALPPVRIVDLREEMKAKPSTPKESPRSPGNGGASEGFKPLAAPAPPPSVLGQALTEAVQGRIARREQVILFLNRRGFASFLLCRDCGFAFRCPNCDVSLTYHKGAGSLRCHHCDFGRPAPACCPRCAGLRLRPFGLGTERVEQDLARTVPAARILRMDRDTMTRKGAHADTLRAFRKGDADVLVGTQMVAKGLDFPNVTLVGVVSADTALNLPDFRASERAFQLLTQVAGRAGRADRAGEVIIQTFTPEHESVQRAASHDYLGFYADAIAQRREVGYPPFARLANAVFSDEDEAQARQRAHRMADILRSRADAEREVLGPAPCPLARLRGRYRWHLALRTRSPESLLPWLRWGMGELSQTDRAGLALDIDPLTML